MNDQSYSESGSVVQSSRYALSKGLGIWEVTFAGRTALLKHEQGLYYAAYLLTHPRHKPLHAVALAVKVAALYYPERLESGSEVTRTVEGKVLRPDRDAVLQQRNLGMDQAETALALRGKQRELEALVDGEETSEPVKAEALRELEDLYAYQKAHPGETRDAAMRCVRAVTASLKRLHQHLQQAVDTAGAPHPVLRPFADHLYEYVLAPSGKCGQLRGGLWSRGLMSGCYVYEPPTGVIWSGR